MKTQMYELVNISFKYIDLLENKLIENEETKHEPTPIKKQQKTQDASPSKAPPQKLHQKTQAKLKVKPKEKTPMFANTNTFDIEEGHLSDLRESLEQQIGRERRKVYDLKKKVQELKTEIRALKSRGQKSVTTTPSTFK